MYGGEKMKENCFREMQVLYKIQDLGREIIEKIETEEKLGKYPKKLAEEFLIYLELKKRILEKCKIT